MPALRKERVLSVHHWNDKLFSLTTTRDPGFRFRNGQFVMLGLDAEPRPIMRAYSIASPNWEDRFEFFSIKVDDGALTSKLRRVQPGDEVLLSEKPVGTLVLDDLKHGKRLFLLATGTGLAPYLGIIQDPEAYERFEQIVVVHCVRREQDLAYRDFITTNLPEHEYLGELVREQLVYYPIVTREPFKHRERIPLLLTSGRLCDDIGIPAIDSASDRAMICGSLAMLADTRAALDVLGFEVSPSQGVAGDYVFERAFVDSVTPAKKSA